MDRTKDSRPDMSSRRNFLIRSAHALLALATWMPVRLFAAEPDHWRIGGTMQAYLDTLIPADETPGAVQLGVDARIQEEATDMWYYGEIIRKGAAWLDGQAHKRWSRHFHELNEAEREEIVQALAGSDPRSAQHKFFRRTRKDAFRYYYSDPRSWPGMPYAGTPQPLGFPDYHAPPVEKTAGDPARAANRSNENNKGHVDVSKMDGAR